MFLQAKQIAPIAEGECDPTPEAIERTLTSSVAHRLHRMVFAGRTMLFNGDVDDESQVDNFAAALLKVHFLRKFKILSFKISKKCDR